MRVVIVEDEIAAQRQLESLLHLSGVDVEVLAIIDSVQETVDFFRSSKAKAVDLVFMDIHLADGDAFSIFKHVEIALPIIFTTAYDEYAIKAFEVQCVDYVLKPIQTKDIERIIEKIGFIEQYGREQRSRGGSESLLVLDSWRMVPLRVEDIAFCYKDGVKVLVYGLDGRRYSTNLTLEKLEQRFDRSHFTRANRQFIVARRAVEHIESYQGSRARLLLSIETPEQVVISRTKVAAFKRWMVG